MQVAFFDFDGTLTRHDSFIGFALFTAGRFRMFREMLRISPYIIGMSLGLKKSGEVKEMLFGRIYGGMEYEKFKLEGEKYAQIIDGKLRKDVVKRLNNHLKAGDKVAIVSASVGDWIRPWAIRYGVAEVIATEVEVDENGRLTGRFATANCKGEEKVRRIKEKWPEIELIESWGYGDSAGDEAMLKVVKHPVKV